MNNINQIDTNSEEFGTILNCAVRHSCGRQTYMPKIVIDFIKPLLPQLSPRTLGCMERDIRKADEFGGYGDEKTDKPEWLQFLSEIRKVMDERGIQRWN